MEKGEEKAYDDWVENYKKASEEILDDLRYKTYYSNAWNALNGFYRCLKAHRLKLAKMDVADRVDFYFIGGVYAESTESAYRRFISKVLERI